MFGDSFSCMMRATPNVRGQPEAGDRRFLSSSFVYTRGRAEMQEVQLSTKFLLRGFWKSVEDAASKSKTL